jgi:beta-galactosidase
VPRDPTRGGVAAGVWYDEYSNLTEAVPVVATDPHFALDAAASTRWADGLTAEGATVLAAYEHPHFGQWPAVTTRRTGQGRITCVGTVPDAAFVKSLMTWASPPDAAAGTSAACADAARPPSPIDSPSTTASAP